MVGGRYVRMKGTVADDRMIYSSITPYVHMLYTAEDDTDHVLLDFSSHRRGRYIMEDDVSSVRQQNPLRC